MPYADPAEHRRYHREYNRKWADRNREAERARLRRVQQDRKARALDALGGVCACCGEAEKAFLVIDHVDGGGTGHRKRISTKGLYSLILRGGIPDVLLQVLCANCNMAKERVDGCPHGQAGVEADRRKRAADG